MRRSPETSADQVEAFLEGNYRTVLQSERRGTGHAVMMAREYLREIAGGDVLVLCGDAPFIGRGVPFEARLTVHTQSRTTR